MQGAHHFNLYDKEMNNPLVSVIVPIYGVERYISRCAYSLMEQTYSNVEYVFVNDCTKDSSMEILNNVIAEFPSRKQQCRILDHIENKGLAAARNTGINVASGDFIMHVDSDDYLEKDAIESLVAVAVIENSDIVVAGFNSVNGDSLIKSHYPEHLPKDQYIRRILNMSVYTNVWAKLYASSLFGDGKYTRPIEGVNHGEDYATLPRILYYAEKISYLDKCIYNYLESNTSSFTKNFSGKSMEDIVKANNVLHDFFKDKVDESELRKALLRTKLAMYKYGNLGLFDEIGALYPELTKSDRKQLPLKDRILLCLIDIRLYKIAGLYIQLGLKYMRHVN